MKATEKWGGKVRTGGDESGRLRGSGAQREAGEPVCQALTWVSQTSHVTDTQTHTHAHFSVSIYCVLLALPGRESSQTEGCATQCQSV